MNQIQSTFKEFVQTKGPGLPLPGAGNTWRRFSSLAEQASIDLSLGRLCEGHADAIAILAEAGRAPVSGASYGVWISRGTVAPTLAARSSSGWRLSGTKEFCSGSGIVERALVSAETDQGQLIFDIPVDEHVVSVVPESWPSVGMAASRSETLEFGGPVIPTDYVVGDSKFYLERPGYWFGAVGIAACWYGCAVGIVNNVVKSLGSVPSDDMLSELGLCVGALETMRTALKCAAASIDEDSRNEKGRAQFQSLVTRQLVHDAALTVLQRAASAGGARPLCLDEEQSRRVADLFAYLSQHRGNTEARELGRLLTGSR